MSLNRDCTVLKLKKHDSRINLTVFGFIRNEHTSLNLGWKSECLIVRCQINKKLMYFKEKKCILTKKKCKIYQ